jgi:hypothetical protein
VLRASQAVISVRLDSKRIEALQLDISSYTVADAVLRTPKIKLKFVFIMCTCFYNKWPEAIYQIVIVGLHLRLSNLVR